MRDGHVGLDALGVGPRNMSEERFLEAEASARLAGGRVVRAVHELDRFKNGLVFGYDEFAIQGDIASGLRGHGVHVGRVAEVDGGRATAGGIEAMKHFP
jgi:hypothetical protein